MRPVDVFVAPDGNAFMHDIASWIREACELTGRAARVVDDGSLPGDRSTGSGATTSEATALVVAPHELFELSDRPKSDRRRAAALCVPIATEQPGTPWFERSLAWCRLAPWTIDINETAVREAVRSGLDCRLLRLGAVPSMDRRRGRSDGPDVEADEADRPIDVAVLAGLTPSRERALASLAPRLWHRRCELRLFPTDRPVQRSRAAVDGTVFGVEKYDLLASTKVLLNLHRDDSTVYFEWARAVEAMANGCVIVTEPSESIDPLVDGEHLVVTDRPGEAIDRLLDDPVRRSEIAAAAAELVHGPLALHRSLGPLLDAAEATTFPPSSPAPGSSGSSGSTASRVSTWIADRRSGGSSGRSVGPSAAPMLRPAFRPHREIRRRLFDAVVAERGHRRSIDAARALVRHGAADHVVVADTTAWAGAQADVSVVVTLFDFEDLVVETLDSVVASTGVEIELIVVDDHSTDRGRHVVSDWMNRHDVAVRLIGRSANRGLAAARNLGFEHSRADRVMVLDADNLVYPTCLERLSARLDDEPDAAFTWSILEVFGDRTGLLGAHAWDPDRLVVANRIDAQVMLRRDAWRRLGGYRELDGLLAGWEDWDLWLRMAAAGERGVLVPEMLGRYRAAASSMVSAPNRFTDVMLERFEELHPDLTFPRR